MILKPEREADAKAVFTKWGLDFAVIGTTTDTRPHDHHAQRQRRSRPARAGARELRADVRAALGRAEEARENSSRMGAGAELDPRHAQRADGRTAFVVAPLDLGAVRSHGDGRHHRPSGRRCRCRARPRDEEGDRRRVRCDTALRHRRPRGRYQAGCRRDMAELDCGRRRSTRHHRQHEFRKSRAARSHGPVRRQRSRHGRSLPGARLPGRFR